MFVIHTSAHVFENEHSRAVNKLSFHPKEPNILLSGSQDATMKIFVSIITVKIRICQCIRISKLLSCHLFLYVYHIRTYMCITLCVYGRWSLAIICNKDVYLDTLAYSSSQKKVSILFYNCLFCLTENGVWMGTISLYCFVVQRHFITEQRKTLAATLSSVA